MLWECVPEQKQKIIEYYIQYGTLIGNKLNKSDQESFMKNLKAEEFEAY